MDEHKARTWLTAAFADGYRAGIWTGYVISTATAVLIFIVPFAASVLMAVLSVGMLLAFHAWGPTATREKEETLDRILFEMRHDLTPS